MKNNDATRLFLDKEGKELRGKRNFNFFVLVVIFAIAIMSIGFGSASIKYLQYKMDDPFINWVDIIVRQKIVEKGNKTPLEDFLKDSIQQSNLQFEAPEASYLLNIDFRHQEREKNIQFQGRSINSNSSIFPKILDEDNVIFKSNLSFINNGVGLILTQTVLTDLGYSKIPQFVYLALSYDKESCAHLGIKNGINGNYPVAFPVYAVVKQLPGMNSFLFSSRFLQDFSANNKTAFDITDIENNSTLNIVGTKSDLDAICADLNTDKYSYQTGVPYKNTWDNSLYSVKIEARECDMDETQVMQYNELYRLISAKCQDITRIYDFVPIQEGNYTLDAPAYYSIQIKNLANIKKFQERLYEHCGIKLEMTSIDQKNNFQFVQRMGNILSICIIFIAVIFICFFIYFMLSTHFARIQRNLGTFKAFGIENSMLYYIYVVIMLRITLASYVVSFILSWVCGFVVNSISPIEQGYNWIEVLVWQNLLLLLLVILASVIASYFVAKAKLKHTPGDLIYNRNSK